MLLIVLITMTLIWDRIRNQNNKIQTETNNTEQRGLFIIKFPAATTGRTLILLLTELFTFGRWIMLLLLFIFF